MLSRQSKTFVITSTHIFLPNCTAKSPSQTGHRQGDQTCKPSFRPAKHSRNQRKEDPERVVWHSTDDCLCHLKETFLANKLKSEANTTYPLHIPTRFEDKPRNRDRCSSNPPQLSRTSIASNIFLILLWTRNKK